MEALGRSLMSLAILMYGVIPLFADLNETHATHPLWPPHARFHVVTQVLTTSSIAVVAFWLLWRKGPEPELSLCLATVLSFCVIGSFFVSAFFTGKYGGALRDTEGGITPFRKIDLNALNFASAMILLILGRLLILSTR